MRTAAFGAAACLFVSSAAVAADFSYDPPGILSPSSAGTGRQDPFIYAPGMRFPIESGPAYANSQVYGHGGNYGPGGSQCDAANFAYPWHDNYCETRSWDMPLCPTGTGHQGQDIRAATCDKDTHWTVSTVNGKVTSVGSYSVYITGADGTRYDYLHMGSVQVAVGQSVTRGQRIGKVSNVFGGTPTTVHLHFNLRQNVAGVGTVYVPPYTSLIAAYQELVGPVARPATGLLASAECGSGVQGWARDPDAQAQPIKVRVGFDGGLPPAAGLNVTADFTRDELCEPLGWCDYGFYSTIPARYLDGAGHSVAAWGVDSDDGTLAELDRSPLTFTCEAPELHGVRRLVSDEAYAGWGLFSFLDELGAGVTGDALPKGSALPTERALVTSSGSAEAWVIDGAWRRRVPSPTSLAAWHLARLTPEVWTEAQIEQVPEGPELRDRPLLVRDSEGALYLIDDAFPAGAGAGGGLPGAGGADAHSTAGAGGAGGSGSDLAPLGSSDDGGCSCGFAPRSIPASWAALLGLSLLGLARSRRRSR